MKNCITKDTKGGARQEGTYIMTLLSLFQLSSPWCSFVSFVVKFFFKGAAGSGPAVTDFDLLNQSVLQAGVVP
ncbi:hypothetical protein [Treponema primitia]|uniref:hypothetical protein n=1 Tax=Treponema primitia TaxID=88058 RepID=UPI000255516A|nr:hypothetical protein [Treponema primitia]